MKISDVKGKKQTRKGKEIIIYSGLEKEVILNEIENKPDKLNDICTKYKITYPTLSNWRKQEKLNNLSEMLVKELKLKNKDWNTFLEENKDDVILQLKESYNKWLETDDLKIVSKEINIDNIDDISKKTQIDINELYLIMSGRTDNIKYKTISTIKKYLNK